MKTVKILLAAAVVSCLAGAGYAQKADRPAAAQRPAAKRVLPPRPKVTAFHRALARLDLSDAQKAQIKAIEQALAARVKALRADTTLTPEQKRAQVQAATKEAREKILAVLTPEQRQKLRVLMARMQGVRADFWAMVQRLDLTPEQRAKIRVIRAETQEKLLAVRRSDATPEQKRQRAQRIAADAREKVLALLTDAQKRQLREWLAKHPGLKPPAK